MITAYTPTFGNFGAPPRQHHQPHRDVVRGASNLFWLPVMAPCRTGLGTTLASGVRFIAANCLSDNVLAGSGRLRLPGYWPWNLVVVYLWQLYNGAMVVFLTEIMRWTSGTSDSLGL